MTETSTPPARANPWMTALVVTWSLLLCIALVLCLVAANAAGAQQDPALALALDGAAAGAAGLAVVVGSIQLGVRALRWYLDESSRPARPQRTVRPYVRQDF